jgi:hypothetical protein
LYFLLGVYRPADTIIDILSKYVVGRGAGSKDQIA